MGLIESDKKGITKHVRLASNLHSRRLLKIITERSHLDLNKIISGSKLRILPLFLEPGYRAGDIAKRSGLSSKTVSNMLKLWTGMGIVRRSKTTKRYYLNPDHKYLIEFIVAYTEHRSNVILRDHFEDAVIIWNWRDEFIFSIPYTIKHKNFIPSGFTRLDEFNYDLLHTAQYYKFDPLFSSVSEEEALVQSILIDPLNPRAMRSLNKRLGEEQLDIEKIYEYASKYSVHDLIQKGIRGYGG
jgi:DNA-binding Lrp family transcriptional regulator